MSELKTEIILLSDKLETKKLGYQLAQKLEPNSVLLLSGNLGAGKTTFIQGIGEALGIEDSIVSPTFTLINEYTEGKLPLYHIDLYRIEPDRVADLHLELYWQGEEFPAGVTAIEWSERLPTLPPNFVRIHFAYTDREDTRQLTWAAWGEDATLLLRHFWQAL